jgi:hypothetical protein
MLQRRVLAGVAIGALLPQLSPPSAKEEQRRATRPGGCSWAWPSGGGARRRGRRRLGVCRRHGCRRPRRGHANWEVATRGRRVTTRCCAWLWGVGPGQGMMKGGAMGDMARGGGKLEDERKWMCSCTGGYLGADAARSLRLPSAAPNSLFPGACAWSLWLLSGSPSSRPSPFLDLLGWSFICIRYYYIFLVHPISFLISEFLI